MLGEEPLMIFFYNFALVLFHFTNIIRNAVLQRKWMEIALFLPIVAGEFCLVPYWLTASFLGFSSHLASGYYSSFIWKFPSSFPIAFTIAPNNLRAFPSGCSFQHCPAAVQEALRAFSSGCWQKRGNFYQFSLKH